MSAQPKPLPCPWCGGADFSVKQADALLAALEEAKTDA